MNKRAIVVWLFFLVFLFLLITPPNYAIELFCNYSTSETSEIFNIEESSTYLAPILISGNVLVPHTDTGESDNEDECLQKKAELTSKGCRYLEETESSYLCRHTTISEGKIVFCYYDDEKTNFKKCVWSCTYKIPTSGCNFQITSYALDESQQQIGDYAKFEINQQPVGSFFNYSISFDLDEIWALVGVNPLLYTSIPALKFVADPFVLLNGSLENNQPYTKFHEGAKTNSVNCQARDSEEGIKSDVECVTFPISKKIADCRGELPNNKCCGDDDLINPGFEASISNEKYISSAWNITKIGNTGCTKKEGQFCYTDSTTSHSGYQSYKMQDNQSRNSGLLQEVGLISNQNYYLSAYVKTINNNKSGAYLGVSNKNLYILPGTNSWRHYWLPFTSSMSHAPLTIHTIGFYAGSNQPNEYQLWVDDIHLIGKDMDLGDIQKVDRGESLAPQYFLCYFNGTEWNWLDSLEQQNAFKIKTIGGFDILSNTLKWEACNARGMAGNVYSSQERKTKVDLIKEEEIVKFEPPEVVPSVVLPEEITTPGYEFEDSSTALIIPENQFLGGLQLTGKQPLGAPLHCFNDETDGNESDKNCGNGCAKCSDGQKCFTNNDCFSGLCDNGMCVPPLTPETLKTSQYLAKRFICSRQDELDVFTECCGSSLGNCINKDEFSKIRRTGNTLSTIYEFLPRQNYLNSVNYVLMFGLPLTTTIDYNLPLFIESYGTMRAADTRITNWSSYDYLEFYISYAHTPISKRGEPYLRLLILNKTLGVPPRQYFENESLQGFVLFKGYVSDFVVNQEEAGEWLHVKIPIKDNGDKITAIRKSDNVKFISIFAYKEEVPDDKLASHSLFPANALYRNIIGIDRIFLSKNSEYGNSDSFFCAQYPPFEPSQGHLGSYWVSDLDDTSLDITKTATLGETACKATPGYGWTGNACCGDDTTQVLSSLKMNKFFVAESYSDTLGGCLKGIPVWDNTVKILKYNNTRAGETSLLFFGEKFYSCNNKNSFENIIIETNFTPQTGNINRIEYSLEDIDTSSQYPECYNIGSWYCDFDGYWKNATKIINETINTARTLPFNSSVKGCCPASYCFVGYHSIRGVSSNETGALVIGSECVPNQASYFAAEETKGLPYFFDSTKYFASGVKGDDNYYRCINGMWQPAVLKWDPTHTKQGYCPSLNQCYFNSTSCLDDKAFFMDNVCDNGEWTSRTKYLANQLLNLTKAVNYTLYCDDYDKVLSQFDYWDVFSPVPAKKILLGNQVQAGIGGQKYECPNFVGKGVPCTNNFCALKYQTLEGEKVAIGTSLNLPLDTLEYAEYSILNLFREAVEGKTAGSDYNDYCDAALRISEETGNFVGCKGFNEYVLPGQKASIWVNNKTQTLIYITQGETLAPETTGQLFLSLFKHPINTAYYIVWNYFSYKNNIQQTFDFLNSLGKFNKIYISSLNDKEIRGVVEEEGLNKKMVVSYKNIRKNLCYDNTTSLQLGIAKSPFLTTRALCGVFINESDGRLSFWQNYVAETDQNWKELTSNTRLQWTGPVEKMDYLGIELSFPNYVEIGEEVEIAIRMTKPGLELLPEIINNITAYVYDFGDGNVYSTNIPTAAVTHAYTKQGTFTPSFGVLSRNFEVGYFKGAEDDCKSSIKVIPQLPNLINGFEDSPLILNFSGYADEISISDNLYELFDCNEQSNLFLNCSPKENFFGEVNISVNLTYCGVIKSKNLTINIMPVNDAPQFTEEFPYVEFVEDYDFSANVPFSIDVLGYVYDNETPKENLKFSISSKDNQLIKKFGCGITANKQLTCLGPGLENWNGLLNIVVNVTDGFEGGKPSLSASQNLTINITPVNDPPTLSFPLILGVKQDSTTELSFSDYINDVDIDYEGDSLLLNCSTITIQGTIEPKLVDNKIICTLTDGYTSVYGNITIDNEEEKIIIKTSKTNKDRIVKINFSVIDKNFEEASQLVNINIYSEKVPPTINAYLTSHNYNIINEGEVVNFTINATDENEDSISISYNSYPTLTNVILSPVYSVPGYSEVNLSWKTPSQLNQEKIYTITFVAKDSSGLSSDTTSILVINDIPKGEVYHIYDAETGNYTFNLNIGDMQGDRNDNLEICTFYFGNGESLTDRCDTNLLNTYFEYNYGTIPVGTCYQPYIEVTDDLGTTVQINDTEQICG